MRILITNDDGINAPGLGVLHEIAVALTGDPDRVWTVAPAFENSGVGHCISYTRPMMVAQLSKRAFAVEGTPADCVLAALYDVMSDCPPDLVLSGVNRGNNSAENAMYSGTLGAAMEAALQGLPAIALSQYYGPENRDLDDQFASARAWGLKSIRKILDVHEDNAGPYKLFYNVNFPPVPAEDVRGLRVVAQGRRPDAKFFATSQASPAGRNFLWLSGSAQGTASAPNTDAAVNLEGYVSVTPMRADLTAHDVLAKMAEIE